MVVALAVAAALTLALADGFRVARHMANASIANGGAAEPCFWKWMVGIRGIPDGPPFCGGSLIDPEWVLTAAHCLERETRVNVIAGEYNTGVDEGTEINIWSRQLYVNPFFVSQTKSNDFGLIRLEAPFVLNDCIGTVTLPLTGEVANGWSCWITGWGKLGQGGAPSSTLQQAAVKPMSNADCKSTGYTNNQILANMRCATGTTSGLVADSCLGDRGGGLVCIVDGAWRIYGISSWGNGCANPNYPGVYARVRQKLSWIQNTMNGTNPIR